MNRGPDGLLAEVAAFSPGPGGVRVPQLCRRLRQDLGLDWIGLVLADGREFSSPGTVPAGPVHRVPLRAGDQPTGYLLTPVPPGRLPAGLIDLLGPVLAAVPVQNELDRELETARDHAEEVAALRRRTFVERDAERRAIEQDLHDGVQHHLVTLGLTVGLVDLYTGRDDPEALRRQLLRMREGLDTAESAMMITATEGSPRLRKAGIHAALSAEFDGTPVVLEALDWDTARRHEPEVELAVYFICLEAANNARKHAPGADVVVRLAETPTGLTFSVTDDGPGMGEPRLEEGSGLAGMRRRIAAADGDLRFRTAAGRGTVVEGFIPY